jgi:hypothetical protein
MNVIENIKGKLGTVYTKTDLTNMKRFYTVFFINDGNGNPLKASLYPELIGKKYEIFGKNKFKVWTEKGQLIGSFLEPINEYEDLSEDDLTPKELMKRAEILENAGYVVLSKHDIRKGLTKKEARKILTVKNWDEIYESLPEKANDLYWSFTNYGREEDDIFKIPGIIWRNKDGTIKYIVHR